MTPQSSFWARRTNQVCLGAVLAVVLVVVGLFGITRVSFERSQSLRYADFRAHLSDGTAPVDTPVRRGTPVAIVKAPTIGLDAVVLEGSDTSTLQHGVGHLRSSVLPGQKGTSVLFGKHTTYGGVFRHLGNLKAGDAVSVASAQGTTTYTVVEVKTYNSSDGSAFAPAGDAIRLVTSSSALGGGGRLSVLAVAQDGSAKPIGARGLIEPISADELGMNFDHSAAGGLLAWLQVLLLASVLGTYLAHRWGLRRAWMFVAPVALVVALATIVRLSAILPSLM